jgi:penicillin-binding protein 1A
VPDVDIPRRRRRRQRRRRSPLLVVALVVVGLLAAAAVAGGGGVYAFGSSCDLASLHEVKIGQNTFVYAADGSLLGAIPAERNRQVVSLGKVSPWVPKATVAIEDRRFWTNSGIDPEGIARAVVADIKARRFVQGGSTITQQLVRNLYISNERTVQRKLKEACLAIKLNDAWSKQRILASYLNQVYYGNLAYGIEAASQTYFSKPASDLTLRESALLAGLTQAPSAYNPFVEPGKALSRRNAVLRAMRDQGAITPRQYASATRSRDLGLEPGRLYNQIKEPYFFGYVRDQLIRKYGAETVRSGGLSVYTTIVPRWQKAAQEAIRNTLTEPDDPASAVISIDPSNGAIRAMAAVIPGRSNNQFNLLSQARRQPGSTFKTFVLATAIEQGIDPDTSYYVSAPFTYKPVDNGNCEDGSWWCVRTYDSSYNGWTSISRATLRSDNTVYAQLTLDVGADKVGEMARKLGVRSPLKVGGRYVPAMGLGSIAVSPLDMASAYATLAAGGIYSEPTAIRKVVLPNGKEDTKAGWGSPKRTRVIPDGVAWKVTQILEDNVSYGTGVRASFGRPAAGKTGTTDKHADAWFVGYTPDLATAVWMGYQAGEIPMEDVHGIAVSGGSFPAEIWRLMMEHTIGLRPPRDFTDPKAYPVYQTFHRGPLALSYDPYYVAPAAPTTTESTSTDTTPTKTPPDKQDKPDKATKPPKHP